MLLADARKDVEERVKNIIIEELRVDRTKLIDDASFAVDLGADSLDLIEMVMSLEKEFDIDIPDSIAEELHTVGPTVKYLQERMEK